MSVTLEAQVERLRYDRNDAESRAGALQAEGERLRAARDATGELLVVTEKDAERFKAEVERLSKVVDHYEDLGRCEACSALRERRFFNTETDGIPGVFDTCDWCVRADAQDAEVERLREALERSLKLQSHYAELLNMHDGGERIGFATVDDWLKRLATLDDEARKHHAD